MDNKPFKVGDKVFDLRFGNGLVVPSKTTNRIYVVFSPLGNTFWTYCLDGKVHKDHATAMLHHGHDLIVEVKEPVYEYQILFVNHLDRWELTPEYYTSGREWDEGFNEKTDTLFEPSKRLRK